MNRQMGVCCSSPGTICYWLIVALIAEGGLKFIGVYWRPLHASPAATCLFAMSIGCVANWLRHRSFHCVITGPLFLIGGVIFLFSGMHLIDVNTRWVWPVVLIVVAIAFVLEWRIALRSAK